VSEWCFDYRPNITRRWYQVQDGEEILLRDGATAVAKLIPLLALPATLRPKVGVTTSAPVKWTSASLAALDDAGMNELDLL
jgi:antitoxin (DNA-binding transcriptional repressor) of toxin-antitoxin stability system